MFSLEELEGRQQSDQVTGMTGSIDNDAFGQRYHL
jgi:hypothetical protein